MASGKTLLKRYVKKYHKQDIEDAKTNKKQCKISIDYNQLNPYLIDNSGKDFWDLQIYKHIDITIVK